MLFIVCCSSLSPYGTRQIRISQSIAKWWFGQSHLWGNLQDIDNIRPPHEIIEVQGQFLTEMSKNLLELKIERKQRTTIINYDIFINAPSMNVKQRIFR